MRSGEAVHIPAKSKIIAHEAILVCVDPEEIKEKLP